jgi:hypothetical protein
MEQAGIVARVGEKRITYKISVEKSEEIYWLKDLWRDVKTILKLIFKKQDAGLNCIYVDQGMYEWLALMGKVKNRPSLHSPLPVKGGEFLD